MNMKDSAQNYASSTKYSATYAKNGDLYPSEGRWTTYDPPKPKWRGRLRKNRQPKPKKQ